jgi:Flp pilus assembly protein TadD
LRRCRDTQGWVYRAQRKFSEAETVLEKAATMKPPLADVKYHLGLVYLDQRKTDQAKKAFREALAIDAKHAPSKQVLQKLGDAS